MHNSQWTSAAHSNIGTVRKINEDGYLEAPEARLWCVADGMGGHNKGDVASETIIDKLRSLDNPALFPITVQMVADCLQAVNGTLRDLARSQPEASVIGSTVAVLLCDSEQAHCLWAGDSRIYRLRGGQLHRLTRDHSQVEDMVDAGVLRADQAEHHPAANVITRAVGAHRQLDLDQRSFDILPGDIFLLCTDGLNKVVSDTHLRQVLVDQPLHDSPRLLIQHALNAQARDNITVVTVQYRDTAIAAGANSELDQTRPLHG